MQDFIFEWQQHTEARPRTGPCTLHAAGLLHASQDAEMRGAALPSPLQSVRGETSPSPSPHVLSPRGQALRRQAAEREATTERDAAAAAAAAEAAAAAREGRATAPEPTAPPSAAIYAPPASSRGGAAEARDSQRLAEMWRDAHLSRCRS